MLIARIVRYKRNSLVQLLYKMVKKGGSRNTMSSKFDPVFCTKFRYPQTRKAPPPFQPGGVVYVRPQPLSPVRRRDGGNTRLLRDACGGCCAYPGMKRTGSVEDRRGPGCPTA